MLHRIHATAMPAVAVILTIAPPAAAQMAFHTPSAAQPSEGTVLVRSILHHAHYEGEIDGERRDVEEMFLNTEIDFGLTNSLALMVTLPVGMRDETAGRGAAAVESDNAGLGDAHAMLRWRVLTHDTGPIDTMRLSLLAGVELPTATDDLGSEHFNPMIGAAFMAIRGRHGYNAALRWMFTTGEGDHRDRAGQSTADVLFADAAYLFRIAPAEYGLNDLGAHYLMLELNGAMETNGDRELLLAPGYMFEGRTWAFEASIQVPLWQDIDERLETDVTVGAGLRFLF
jgi:hypothetical protein